MHPCKPLKRIALVAICFVVSSCSSPKTGNIDTGSINGTLLFEHSTERRSDGKTKLTVVPVAGFAQDEGEFDGRVQSYAEAVVKRACPKGHDLYADTPLTSRRNERTYVFQCK